MDTSHPLLPGPRESTVLPSASSPNPQVFTARSQWVTEAALPQPRSSYVSPDGSPTSPFYPTGARLRANEANNHLRYVESMPEFYNGLERRVLGGVPMVRSSPMWGAGAREADPYFNPPYADPPKQKRHNKPKKSDGKQPTFLTKLYSILDQPEYHHIIRWDDAGDVIVIEKPEELADKILPLVYKQSRFASFSRQLNIYGFMRKVSLRHVDRGIVDPDASTWSHPFLRRDSTHADIIGFKRRVPPRPSQSRRRASMLEESHSASSGSDGSYHGASPPDAYHQHLFEEQFEAKPLFNNYLSLLPQRIVQDEYPARHASRTIPLPVPGTGNDTHSLFRSYTDASTSLVPQSAPPVAGSFPTAMRIQQGHIRTRSVQGEPPSATFSPSSPLAQPGWLPDQAEPSLVAYGGDAPPYNSGNPSSWARRGYIDASTYSPHLSPLGMQPASLPSDVAPASPPGPQPHRYSHPHSHGHPSQGQPPSQNQHHPLPEGQSLPRLYASALSDDSPTTVSPGVYQAGFSLPAYRPMQVPSAASSPGPTLARPAQLLGKAPSAGAGLGAGSARQARRSSLSSSPYSPRTKLVPSLMFKHEGDDEALPSASLKGLHPRHPFEGLIEEGGISSAEVANAAP